MKSESKMIRHQFTPEEITGLNREFHQAIKQIHAVESEFDSIKASYKAKTAESQARADNLSATIDAGFEMRDTKCVVVYRVKERAKDYFAETDVADDKLVKDAKPLHSEPMTDQDLQMELMDAESKFELKEEIALFQATEHDSGILVVGKQSGKWFGAFRANVGGRKLEERLDGEQPCCKTRAGTVARAVKRFGEWLKAAHGKEVADGFAAGLDTVVEAHKLREE